MQPRWKGTRSDLVDRVVIVIGGSGGVGEGVVRALLSNGATVIATGRDGNRLAELRSRIDDGRSARLFTETLTAGAADLDAQAARLAEKYGRFDGVIVSVASWGSQGRTPALALTDRQWDELIEDNLTAVFRLLRAFVPHTRSSGIVLQLNGMSADLPFPGAAGVALSAAATKSLTRTIAAELHGRGPRVYQLVLGVVRTRARQAAGVDDARWLEGEQIGEHVAELLAGTSPLSATALHYFVDAAEGPVAGTDRY